MPAVASGECPSTPLGRCSCREAPHAAHAKLGPILWLCIPSMWITPLAGPWMFVVWGDCNHRLEIKMEWASMGKNTKFQVLLVGRGSEGRSFCNVTGMQGLSRVTLHATCSPGSWQAKPLNYHQISKSELGKVGTAWVSIQVVLFIGFGQVFLCS